FAERNVCEQNLRISPNPKNEQSNVCILGEGLPDDLSQAQLNIYLEFRESGSKDFSIQSQSKFLDPDYYSLVACTGTIDEPVCNTTDLLTTDTSSFSFNRVYDKETYSPEIYYNTGIDIIVKNTSDNQLLQFNTIYKLTINNIIDDRYANPAAQFAAQDILFKIINSVNFENECKGVDSVQVGLTPSEIKYPESSQAKGTALNPQCQLVPNISYQWSDTDNDDVIEDLSTICSGNCERITISSKNTDHLTAQAVITATETTTGADKFGLNTLTVHNSAYCEDVEDCEKNCPGFVGKCTDERRCTPYIETVDPKAAGPENWITVFGCYFGENHQTDGQALFIQAPHPNGIKGVFSHFPKQCIDTVWEDKKIVVEVPSGLSVGGTALQVKIPDTAKYFSNIYNATYQEDVFKLNKETIKAPNICALYKQGTTDSKGQINDPIVLYGKDFDIDDPPNLGNAQAQFSLDQNFADGPYGETPALKGITGHKDQDAESTVAKEIDQGKNYVRAADGEAASNSLPFDVDVLAGPKILKYDPKENEFKPCQDPSIGDVAYCTTTPVVAENQIIEITFNDVELTADPCDQGLTIQFSDDSSTFTDVNLQDYGCTYQNHIIAGKSLQMGRQYQVILDPEHVKDSQGFKLDCGQAPTSSDKCQWKFVLTKEINNIEVLADKSIIDIPHGEDNGQDGKIYTQTFGNIPQDLQESFMVKAYYDIAKTEPITNFITDSWDFKLTGDADFGENFTIIDGCVPPNRNCTLERKAGSMFVGDVTIIVKVGSLSPASTILQVIDPAALKITNHQPAVSTNVCRNGAIDVSFNKAIKADKISGNVKLFIDGGGECFVPSPIAVSGFFDRI
ncbi:MAG: hypothetical protein ABH896_04135, partial [Candidatus Jacksonbacteria bacterium]